MRSFTFVFLLVTAALNKAVVAEEANRWIVVPATQNPIMNQGSPFLFAWRLDTKTGALEMCTYDPGGWINSATKMPAPETFNCTTPNLPAQH